MIYLDWAASAKPHSDILTESINIYSNFFGNPSSSHSLGQAAYAKITEARINFAKTINASDADKVIFTSGGTEANTIALLSTLLTKGKKSIVISAIEHSAIYEQALILQKFDVDIIQVKPDTNGHVNPRDVESALREDTVLVAIMAVNNETGAVQPIKEIAKAIKKYECKSKRPPLLHCDAVQAPACVGFDAAELEVDSAAFSAHKIGGPRGVGALYHKNNFDAFIKGGGQENNLRPGTYNTAGILAFSMAALRNFEQSRAIFHNALNIESHLISGISNISGATIIPETRCHGDKAFSPNIVCAAFKGISGETFMRLLDSEGIAVSTGAACSAAKKNSRVLSAMGINPELAFSTIRISTGRDTSIAEIDCFLETANKLYKKYKI